MTVPLPSSSGAGPLGWDDAWQSVLEQLHDDLGDAHDDEPHRPAPGADRPATTLGRVCRVDRAACEVLVAAAHGVDDAAGIVDRHDTPYPGIATVTARWSPALGRRAAQDPAATPAAGDWVLLSGGSPPGPSAPLSLLRVLPRRSVVRRLGVSGTSHAQVLAANADVVAVVQAMVPDLDLGRIERLLALAWSSGARPVVLLTKADLHPDPERAVRQVEPSAPGCEVIAVSAPAGDPMAGLRSLLAGGATLALLGASGVGKSTLLNALLGAEVMTTAALGVEGKGRHTTVTRELHLAPGGGAVLDTPGLRAVGLQGTENLDALFPEIEELAASCRFADCAHEAEPGCAVLAAIEEGVLPRRRLDSYRILEREAAFQARRSDARLQAEWARATRARSRAHRRDVTSRP